MGNTALNVNMANNPKRNCLSIGSLVYLVYIEKRLSANLSLRKYRVTIANHKMI